MNIVDLNELLVKLIRFIESSLSTSLYKTISPNHQYAPQCFKHLKPYLLLQDFRI